MFFVFFFFFNDTATTEIYTLSLHDALPISGSAPQPGRRCGARRSGLHRPAESERVGRRWFQDRKSTRLNSSHRTISYAVFCLKKKKNISYINFVFCTFSIPLLLSVISLR